MFFSLNTVALITVLILIVGGAAAIGVVLGERIRAHTERNNEPIGVVQGALLGLVGLLLAFGLSMAVARYENRRALVVEEANDIGTTYLRAQLLAEPSRTASLDLLRDYTDAAIDFADQVPDTAAFAAAGARVEELQNELWTAAGDAVRADSTGTAPRLYTEALNNTIDIHGYRVASLGNRVPGPVMLLEVVAAALAAGVLALYLTVIGRSIGSALLLTGILILILFISFDLDRPRRGFINVPTTALVLERASMDGPPAATGP
jgi:hypothetical protein